MRSDQHLDMLESNGLIRRAQLEPELEYLFKHALVQDAAYESILRQDRRALHRAVGEALEGLYPERLGSPELASMLADHFDRAGDAPRAIRYFSQAGDAAAARYANVEALQHYTRALALAEAAPVAPEVRRHLFSQRGHVLQLNAQYEEVLEHYQRMRAVAQAQQDLVQDLAAVSALASIYATPSPLHNASLAQALAHEAVEMSRQLDDRESESKGLWNLLLAYLFAGRPAMAVEYGEQSLAVARTLNARQQVAFTLNDISRAYSAVGRVTDAEAALAEARQLWRELGNLPMLADSLGASGENLIFLGQYERALQAASEGLEISLTIHNHWGQMYTRWVQSYSYIETGKLDTGLAILLDSIESGGPASFSFVRLAARLDMAILYAGLGETDRALGYCQDSAEEFVRAAPEFFRAYLYSVEGRVRVARGDLAEAEAQFRQVEQFDLVDNFMSLAPFHVGLGRCELALAQGDNAGALAAAETFLARVRPHAVLYGVVDVLTLKGEALAGLGRLDEAAAVLLEARRIGEDTRGLRALGPALAALHKVERLRGREASAAEARSAAQSLCQMLADYHPPDLRPRYLALPYVRQILGDGAT